MASAEIFTQHAVKKKKIKYFGTLLSGAMWLDFTTIFPLTYLYGI